MEYTTVNIISSIPFSLRGMSTIAHYSSAKSLDESLSWFHVSWYFNCNCCNFPAKILHQSYNRPFIRSTAAWTVSLVDMRRQSWELFYGYCQRWQKLVRHFLPCSVLANFKYVTIYRTVRTHALQSPIRLSAVASSCSHCVCYGWAPLLSWWGVGGGSSHESTIDESVRSATDQRRISHANTVRWSLGKPGPSALNKPGKSSPPFSHEDGVLDPGAWWWLIGSMVRLLSRVESETSCELSPQMSSAVPLLRYWDWECYYLYSAAALLQRRQQSRDSVFPTFCFSSPLFLTTTFSLHILL